jgi:dTDP-4-amino-4,6-dideoxygalactose transaminase
MTGVPFLDLGRTTHDLREELDGAVSSVLDESRFLHGQAVGEFEEAFAAWCGARHAVGVASGTDAITLALGAAGVGAGDEVVTAANTCVPTIVGIAQAGATPVLADVDPETWTLDASSVDAVCTGRTKAILPVHLYGRLADLDALEELASSRGVLLIEDAAQAHGAERNGRRAGTYGAAAAFSFYPTKNLGALGDGGAVVTDDDELAQRVRALASYGEQSRYNSTLPGGRNSRLDTIQAALLQVKLRRLDEWLARRRAIASRYLAELAPAKALELPAPDAGHAWHLFVVRVPDREPFRDALARAGVGSLVHYPRPIHRQPAYVSLARPGLDVSEQLCDEVVSLPLYPELSEAEVDAVIAAVLEAAA